jgi:hypothetical protein
MTDTETLSNSAEQEPFSNSYILLRRPLNLIPDYCSFLAPAQIRTFQFLSNLKLLIFALRDLQCLCAS